MCSPRKTLSFKAVSLCVHVSSMVCALLSAWNKCDLTYTLLSSLVCEHCRYLMNVDRNTTEGPLCVHEMGEFLEL